MKWIPMLICIHAELCSPSVPIVGPPMPSYEACQEAVSRALDRYAANAREIGMPELGSYVFTRRFILKRCELR